MAYADTRIRSLETAQLCATLGACPRTIGWVTGLPSHFILSKVFDAGHRAPRGRPAYTEDLVFKTTLKIQAELGSFAVKYRELTAAGFTPAASLLTAYQHYLSFTPVPSFSLDEAFFLVSNLDGIWACKTPSLQLQLCHTCQARRLAAFGGSDAATCAFCKEESGERGVRRRVAGRIPPATHPIEVAPTLPQQIEALRIDRELEQVGAHHRVRAAILSAYPDSVHRAPTSLVRIGRALPVQRWHAGVRPLPRAQFSLVATVFRRLTAGGIAAERAVIATYCHARDTFQHAPTPSFDRCFEVISQFAGLWGVAAPTLALMSCDRCGADYLAGTADSPATGSAQRRCPYCQLIRHPEIYLSNAAS